MLARDLSIRRALVANNCLRVINMLHESLKPTCVAVTEEIKEKSKSSTKCCSVLNDDHQIWRLIDLPVILYMRRSDIMCSL